MLENLQLEEVHSHMGITFDKSTNSSAPPTSETSGQSQKAQMQEAVQYRTQRDDPDVEHNSENPVIHDQFKGGIDAFGKEAITSEKVEESGTARGQMPHPQWAAQSQNMIAPWSEGFLLGLASDEATISYRRIHGPLLLF